MLKEFCQPVISINPSQLLETMYSAVVKRYSQCADTHEINSLLGWLFRPPPTLATANAETVQKRNMEMGGKHHHTFFSVFSFSYVSEWSLYWHPSFPLKNTDWPWIWRFILYRIWSEYSWLHVNISKNSHWGERSVGWIEEVNWFNPEYGPHRCVSAHGDGRFFCFVLFCFFPFAFLAFPAISSLAERRLEAAPLSCSHLLYVNQLANRSVRIDVDITTNRHLGTWTNWLTGFRSNTHNLIRHKV